MLYFLFTQILCYVIQPGQVMNQTRRSIDFDPNDPLCDEAVKREGPTHPNFIIIGNYIIAYSSLPNCLFFCGKYAYWFLIAIFKSPGAQKCGTTSLFEYMAQHPLVVKGKRRETHYFDWRWNSKLETPEAHLNFCKCVGVRCSARFLTFTVMSFLVDMNFFHSDLDKYPSLMTGESTPSYLLHGDIVIPRIKSVLPFSDIRFLVMLRDPVARAYSQYHMAIDKSGTPEQLAIRYLCSYLQYAMLVSSCCGTIRQGSNIVHRQVVF